MYTDKPNNKKNTCYCVGGNFWRLVNHWEPAPPIFFADAPPGDGSGYKHRKRLSSGPFFGGRRCQGNGAQRKECQQETFQKM